MHRFRDTTTFTVYVTACDLEMSSSFNKTVEVTGHVCSQSQVKNDLLVLSRNLKTLMLLLCVRVCSVFRRLT